MAPPPPTTLSELLTSDYIKVKLFMVVGVANCQELVKLLIKETRGVFSSTPTLRLTVKKPLKLTLTRHQAADQATTNNEAIDLAVKALLEAEEAREEEGRHMTTTAPPHEGFPGRWSFCF